MFCKFQLLYKNEMVELDVDEVQALLNELQDELRMLKELLNKTSYEM